MSFPFDAAPPARPTRDVYTVARLNREARSLLERALPMLWLEGELTNFARPSSGHWYFSLKDEQAQVRCTMWKTRNQAVRIAPKEGMRVLVRARVSLYEARGEFQLQVESMEDAGVGDLQRRFELLKAKLADEGLFDADRKRPLPVWPRRIGVITSPTGAALQDILKVLGRRAPGIPVLLYPVPVQGAEAPAAISAAIRLASSRAEVDVLIVARGGGSLEDLWAFNDEAVARAIHAAPMPVVSGVGHEVDFTIADFVADVRAPTPSGAAELVSPFTPEWLERYAGFEIQLRRRIGAHLDEQRRTVAWLAGRLRQQHPGHQVRQRGQRLDELEQRLALAIRARLRDSAAQVALKGTEMARHSPAAILQRLRERLEVARTRLGATMQRRLRMAHTQLTPLTRALPVAGAAVTQRHQARFELAARGLHGVSPLATLDRGYAIVATADGRVLTSARDVADGTRITARLADGILPAVVKRD